MVSAQQMNLSLHVRQMKSSDINNNGPNYTMKFMKGLTENMVGYYL